MKRAWAIVGLIFMASCGQTSGSLRDKYDGLRPEPAPFEAEGQGTLRIIIIDVGQGDSTLVIAPTGEAILIDAGPQNAGREKIAPLLAAENIGELEDVIITHYHDDHFGGLMEVLANIAIKGEIYDRGEPQERPASPLYPAYEGAAGDRRRAISAGEHIALGDIDLEVVASGGGLLDGSQIDLGNPPDENAESIALLIEYGGFKMLIAADITGGGGNPPYQTPDIETPLAPLIGDIDVLRVAHHGSLTSTNAAFLAATTPEAAIISVGDDNEFFHPHDSVIKRLLNAGISVYQTERGWLDILGPNVINGNIEIKVEPDGRYSIN